MLTCTCTCNYMYRVILWLVPVEVNSITLVEGSILPVVFEPVAFNNMTPLVLVGRLLLI